MIDTSMLPDFIVEAAEHLEEMENTLLKLEQARGKGNREIMDELFRSVHTIKGAAQFVGIDRVAELSHKLENLLDLIRKGERELTPAVTDLLIESKDRINLLVEELESGQAEKAEVDDLLARIKRSVEGRTEEAAAPAPPPEEAAERPEESIEPRKGRLAEDSISEEYDEELYSIFLQQLKENIPFLYAQTVELSISVDKQDVLYRCSDSIKSLKSSANYMGYEKLAKHYTDWQREISGAIEQLSSGKMPNLSFMQEYIDEIIRSFPQAMDGYSQDEAAAQTAKAKRKPGSETALEALFADEEHEDDGHQDVAQSNDLDLALESIFSDDDEDGGTVATALSAAADSDDEEEPPPKPVAVPVPPPVREQQPSALEFELSEDEYDEELVAIFLKKLQTDVRFLREQEAALPAAADRKEVLARCREAVLRLASSANYMEYHSLAAFCQSWQQALQQAADGSGQEAAGTLSGFLDELVRVYPQAAAGGQTAPQPQAKPVQPTLETVSTEFDRAEETVISLLSPSAPEAAAPAPPPPAAAPEPVVEVAAAAAEPSEDDSDLFARLSNALELSMSPQSDAAEYEMDNVIEKIMDKSAPETVPPSSVPPKPAAPAPEKVEARKAETVAPVSAPPAKPEPLPVIETKQPAELPPQEPLEAEAAAEEPAEEEDAERPALRKSAPRSSIRVDAEKIDYLMNQVGELVVSRAYFAQLVNEMRGLQLLLQERSKLSKSELKPLHEFAFRLSEAGVHLGRVSNELQEGVMKIRMLPIDQLFKRYPRLVRDLTHRSDKDIRLITKGEETELDKMVIESISDPLIHIIRNAVDHGIETAAERKLAGKPSQGTLMLEAYHESDHIVIEITDDGRGIDPKRIRAKALEKGLFAKEELDRMSDPEILRIIMEPGFSTAEKTTETSGRGVGMDVVRKNVERLNGMIEISSKAGQGTRMRIKIPLTMAIIQALMVRVGREKFTIPLTSVEETLRIFRQEISVIEGVDVIHIRDITMPIFRLGKIYHIDRSEEDEDKMFVVVVSTGTQEVGLVVDELLGQEEVVIKPLAEYLRTGSGFGGATILGDGGISLILDIPELVKIAGEDQAEKQEQRSLSFKRKRRRETAASSGEQPVIH
ncbi:MAG: chemotaxis protein CheW [Candidatus Electronema sp. V4]|uniref:chemotaxis protein CheW n=1 Tax=Candidatus Electronema sp. V4 TaxID=3454756 RepID=UPI0040558B6E